MREFRHNPARLLNISRVEMDIGQEAMAEYFAGLDINGPVMANNNNNNDGGVQVGIGQAGVPPNPHPHPPVVMAEPLNNNDENMMDWNLLDIADDHPDIQVVDEASSDDGIEVIEEDIADDNGPELYAQVPPGPIPIRFDGPIVRASYIMAGGQPQPELAQVLALPPVASAAGARMVGGARRPPARDHQGTEEGHASGSSSPNPVAGHSGYQAWGSGGTGVDTATAYQPRGRGRHTKRLDALPEMREWLKMHGEEERAMRPKPPKGPDKSRRNQK